jgi:hypothetical protein
LIVKIASFFRILRFLRILSVVDKLRRIVTTLFKLISFVWSFAFTILSMMYVFSIVGIFLFYGVLYKGNPLLIGTAYDLGNYYKLINFNSFSNAMITLFHLMIVNNWYVTFKAVIAATSKWSIIYFLIYYYTMVLVVLNVAIAFIIEAVKSLSESDENALLDNNSVESVSDAVTEKLIESQLDTLANEKLESVDNLQELEELDPPKVSLDLSRSNNLDIADL